jgi:hypothetical protein
MIQRQENWRKKKSRRGGGGRRRGRKPQKEKGERIETHELMRAVNSLKLLIHKIFFRKSCNN